MSGAQLTTDWLDATMASVAPLKQMLAATFTAAAVVLWSWTSAAQELGNRGPPAAAALPPAPPLAPSPPLAPIVRSSAAATPASTPSQQKRWKRNDAVGEAILWTGLASILLGTVPLLAAWPAKGSTQQDLLDTGIGVTSGGLALTFVGWAIAGVAGNHLEASAPRSSIENCRMPCVSLRPIVAQSGVRISVHTTF